MRHRPKLGPAHSPKFVQKLDVRRSMLQWLVLRMRRQLTPTAEFDGLVRNAGLDPQEVEVSVRSGRGAREVVVNHRTLGLGRGEATTHENAAQAVNGLLDLMNGGSN
jgi:hypothetical protein